METQDQTSYRPSDSSPLDQPLTIPIPLTNERPILYSDRVGEWYVTQKSNKHRKHHGLYLTPVQVADFMAKQIRVAGSRLRVLDPAAGSGILICAAVEALVGRTEKPATLTIVAYEVDPELIPALRAVLQYLMQWCRANDSVELTMRVEPTDFILAHAEALRSFSTLMPYEPDHHDFDIVIANPPYFKINKHDPRAIAAASVVHGQPNIYGLFMAVSAALLTDRGDLIFIVPRSFASGPCFRQFRTVFFEMIRPTDVHVFDSRRDAFSRDDVLQENIIFRGVRELNWRNASQIAPLAFSASRGVNDIDHPTRRTIPIESALDLTSVHKVLRLPVSDDDDAVLALVDSWPNTLGSLGLNISTGPVVPFRATELIAKDGFGCDTHVPLLWMNHVRAMSVQWPLCRYKPEYIRRNGDKPLLVPNKNYVLLRRFSAKEEARRLTAAPYIATDFDISEIGLENHLNYIHRPGEALTADETWGLAALYNSRLLDTYFRAINGNTQVSATELRAMPLPRHETILVLGQAVRNLRDPLDSLDRLVARLVSQPASEELAVG